ncbi:MAG: biotin/lipoyl-binding protein [Anaerolineales bacterium]|nr:biotin/lipoyl-binding protein [Anaerolineales bacterium]
MKYVTSTGDESFEIEINGENDLLVNGQRMLIDFRSVVGQSVYSLIVNGKSYEALVQPTEEGLEVLLHGQLFQVSIEDERQRRLRQSTGSTTVRRGEFHLKAPMPGLIVTVHVREGQEVKTGDRMIVLESMKMQNEISSPTDGTVRTLRIKPGDNVDQNQVLLTLG